MSPTCTSRKSILILVHININQTFWGKITHLFIFMLQPQLDPHTAKSSLPSPGIPELTEHSGVNHPKLLLKLQPQGHCFHFQITPFPHSPLAQKCVPNGQGFVLLSVSYCNKILWTGELPHSTEPYLPHPGGTECYRDQGASRPDVS